MVWQLRNCRGTSFHSIGCFGHSTCPNPKLLPACSVLCKAAHAIVCLVMIPEPPVPLVEGMLFEHERVVQLIEIRLFSLYNCTLKYLQLIVQGKEGNNDSPWVRQNQRFLKAYLGGGQISWCLQLHILTSMQINLSEHKMKCVSSWKVFENEHTVVITNKARCWEL